MATDSKVSVTTQGTGYLVNWDEGDNATLYEFAPALGEYIYDALISYWSTNMALTGNTANFSFDINERTGTGAKYTYVASHGNGVNASYDFWESAEDEMYQKWADLFEYEGTYMEPHILLAAEFSKEQNPSSESFDPFAELLISKAKVTDQQLSGNVSFTFARIGSIVKVTVNGLTEYAQMPIYEARIEFGESYGAFSLMTYDSVLEKVAADPDSEMAMPFNEVFLYPEGVCINDEGSADL